MTNQPVIRRVAPGPQTGGIQEWHDKKAAEQIKEELAATKTAWPVADRHDESKKSGETRKMPLSGKAALDAIKNG
jgi:hypothetical protein